MVIQENLIAALEELAPLTVVGTAEDEPGAIAWLSDPANRCDLAVLDIVLSRGSGLGVLRSLDRAGASCKRVVLSNLSNRSHPRLRSKCLALGASRVFDKSVDIDDLVAYCQQLAAARSDPQPAA